MLHRMDGHPADSGNSAASSGLFHSLCLALHSGAAPWCCIRCVWCFIHYVWCCAWCVRGFISCFFAAIETFTCLNILSSHHTICIIIIPLAQTTDHTAHHDALSGLPLKHCDLQHLVLFATEALQLTALGAICRAAASWTGAAVGPYAGQLPTQQVQHPSVVQLPS